MILPVRDLRGFLRMRCFCQTPERIGGQNFGNPVITYGYPCYECVCETWCFSGEYSMMTAEDAPIMPDSAREIIKAHCPDCGPERNAYLRGKHVVHSSEKNSPISTSDTGMILECCGCGKVFFRPDYWFSEWEEIVDNPYTGQPEMQGGVETTYWPAPVQRKPPEWTDKIAKADKPWESFYSKCIRP
jgi:hypothetical protein